MDQQTPQPQLGPVEILGLLYGERPKLVAMAWSILAHEDQAERVFTELVSAVGESERPFSSMNQLSAWAWKAMRNRCLNLVQRGIYRENELSTAVGERVDQELAARPSSEIEECARALRSALRHLSARERWTVRLRYFKGISGAEVARFTGRDPEAIDAELLRIHLALGKRVRRSLPPELRPAGPSADREFQQMVLAHLEDQVTDEDLARLNDRMEGSEDRVREFNDLRLQASLLRDIGTQLSEEEDAEYVDPANGRGRRRILAGAGVVALVGLLAALVAWGPPWQKDPGHPVTYVHGLDAQFSNRSLPTDDEGLPEGAYELDRGTVQLRFAGGATVTVEGPSRFQVLSEESLRLELGRLTAMVPAKAFGFTVETGLGTIRDLGTEFGVIVEESGVVEVAVFRGSVEVSRSSATTRALTTGEGLRLAADAEPVPMDARTEAHRYPMAVAGSRLTSTPENLVVNPSFEIGPLSRAPRNGRRYRDLPSRWQAARLTKDGWGEIPVKARGTMEGTSQWGHLPTPVHGERYVFIDQGQLFQEVGRLEGGVRYDLKVCVARYNNNGPKRNAAGRFQVGLWSGQTWIAEHFGKLSRGQNFQEVGVSLEVPKDHRLIGEPLRVMLSGGSTMFFDDVRLTKVKQ